MKLNLFFFLLLSTFTFAQVTTSSMNGKVTDINNVGLEGVYIIATHTPSGTQYEGLTQQDGSYYINNMRIGGPYTVEASLFGFNSQSINDIFLTLGQEYSLHIPLSEGMELDAIVISGKEDYIMSDDKTGAATTVTRTQLENLPTISRSSEDFTRLNPMAAEGGSFAGRNDQFNNYSVNGSIFNNPFGLDSATPGGQSDSQPISLDAIDQITVNIAPYDVTQSGFTGASVNAVTKSGTNKFKGTAYGFYRNSDLTGNKVDGTEVPNGDLSSTQFGFAVGGPIVKNKVFFFANLEKTNRSDLGSLFEPNNGDGTFENNESRVLASDMQLISDLLMNTYGYDTGAFSNFRYKSDNLKGLLRLDFNINKVHKLSATYNFLDAFKDQPAHPSALGRRGPDITTLQFENSGYRINNKIHAGIIELKSNWGNFANKLQVGYTAFRDDRDPFSEPFPVINITKDGQNYIIAGHEPFSINNVVDQDVIQLTNNFNYFYKDHNFTFGVSFEKFDFNNSFNLTGYGFRIFAPGFDIADAADVLTSQEFADEVAFARASHEEGNWALAETNLGQWSVYAQDEWSVSEKFKLTYGLRIDAPLYFDTEDKIRENIERKGGTVDQGGVYAPNITYYDGDGNPVQYDQTVLPKGNVLFNPRVGFNYDVNGNKTTQLRGGTGLFSGRFPAVWLGNQVANPDFFFYNMTDPDFKFPQVWKTSLGFDQEYKGWTFTTDLIYTKDLQAQMVQNHGLITPTGTLDGPDTRPIYLDSDRVEGPFGGATNAYVFTNTDKGYSFNASVQIQKAWRTNFVMFGYNYLKAEDANSINAEISSDAYDRNPANIENTNKADLAPSLFGNRHRFLAVVSKKFDYGKGYATTLSLFGELVEGGRYSYTYAGDINNDGSGLNDLIYIPTAAELNDMTFSGDEAAQAAQRAAFESYIQQDDYLNDRRGEYAERYAALSPWYSNIDFKIVQDIPVFGDKKFQLTFDILNVGNLLNDAWGVRERATNTGLNQPIAVEVNDGTPVYSFDPNLQNTFYKDYSLNSRWRAQVGLRFRF